MNTGDEPRSSGECCGGLTKCVSDLTTKAQEFAREEPAKAAGLAFAAGLLLTVLPVGRLLAVLLRLAFAMIRPLLFVLGAVKLFEELDRRNKP
jgi:hypothetical protein